MTSLFQGEANQPIGALTQGSNGPVMSDLQLMLQNEQKQHEDRYKYEHGMDQ